MNHLDFPAFAKRECGIDAVEYVNQFFMKHAKDDKYLAALKQRCVDEGVTSVLIMCDGEGDLGAPDRAARSEAVANHRKWVDAALALGCHAVRVNAHSTGTRDEQVKLVADGLRQLAEHAAPHGLNVLVENHGGFSSDGAWVAEVMRKVDLPNCGTLPDFGNFNDYDRYQGVAEMMPFAKGISAKSFRFNDEGNETETDFKRMMEIAVRAGFHGYVGIEWEGKVPAQEREGILLTKQLLERVRESLASK
ncbi:sugar phosphate isomerase/epimerase family protein [Lacipirellula parvula]|nr:sugar phosphate isomerase/epimerase family protein [Lacipirellula parvula]